MQNKAIGWVRLKLRFLKIGNAGGVVVGSLFVKALAEGAHPSNLSILARNIKGFV